jgi:2-iminobutanoate/2-iminopropanoate deaminase
VKHPDKTATTGSYSAGIICDGWLFVSGHGPQDMRTGQPVRGTIEEEVRLTLSHIGKVLAEAGCGFKDVVKATCHLSNIEDFDRFDRTYREFFSGVMPARTTVQSVMWSGIKVEIDVIARIPSGG